MELLNNASLFHPCIKEAELVCKRHRLIAIKTIRYSGAAVKRLLTLNPDLAVIFLVRDPRGTFWSRVRVFGFPKLSRLDRHVEINCRTMFTDTVVIRDMFDKTPHRIRFLRYEDLARNPVEVSRNIYDFLNLAWNDSIRSTVVKQTNCAAKNVTRANPPKNSAKKAQDSNVKLERARGTYEYETTRPNSYQAAMRWRSSILWNVSVTIENVCRDVMYLWGYSKFHTLAEIRNWRTSNRGRFKLLDMLSSSHANLGEIPREKSTDSRETIHL